MTDLERARKVAQRIVSRTDCNYIAEEADVLDVAALLAEVRAEGRRQGLEEGAALVRKYRLETNPDDIAKRLLLADVEDAIRALAEEEKP